MVNPISFLVGEELLDEALDRIPEKYQGTVAAPNGYLYGIPDNASRVIKFNPVDKSMTHIGPDFGIGSGKCWYRGAMTDNGVIYCPPICSEDHGILKIDTNTDTVTELDVNLHPEWGNYRWRSCATALDGCIYCMPSDAHRIMKIDPNNNDAISSVGDDLGHVGFKYRGTVVGIDGCVYGIPEYCKRIVKYDPINDTTSFVGEEADQNFYCRGGALARDGCIYGAVGVGDRRVLKIDTINNSYSFVGNSLKGVQSKVGFGDAVLGIDGCIYWPPHLARRTLKYDPHSNQILFVGDDFGYYHDQGWISGAMATDGIIYCFPSHAKRILAIDPIGELLATTKANMQEYPEKFGSLFQKIEANEDSPSHASLTNFDLAVVKFGYSKVIEIMEKCIEPVNDFYIESNLCPFMIAASYKESRVGVINHLLRRDLSWVNNCIVSLKGNEPKNKKRRIK